MNFNPVREGKIWHFHNKIILTDVPSSLRRDAVFPLCYENTYFVENLAVRKGDKVLDPCTGSGILALFLAQKASKVYAIDISQRALEFARLNAQFNGLKNIDFRCGDLFKLVQGMKFNLVTANPPFEPVSYDAEYPIHSAGGNKGTDVLKRILSDIDNHVAQNGSFQIITWIPESSHDVLENFDKRKYRFFTVKKLRTYSAQQVQEYLTMRIGHAAKINESYSLCFIQALRKSCR